MITEKWKHPATIERNNFKFKSLSSWSYNIAVGCEHACLWCYVPQVSTIRMSKVLAAEGVNDPDAEWGSYVFIRRWNERRFMNSLVAADHTPASELNPDGNRAVMLCTTTDPYQTVRTPELQKLRADLVRNALIAIRDKSTLNVRILTRSPLARTDFDLFKSFGPRLLFGMSLPTLNNRLAKIYEPKAPAPSQRLATLKAAKEAGLHVYVAVAPVYPECDAPDMAATLAAIKELDPVTIFMEPINIRADNVARIKGHASSIGETMMTEVFETTERWRDYALQQLIDFQVLTEKAGLGSRLHLWPDQALGSQDSLRQFRHQGFPSPTGHVFLRPWLEHHWSKISAWPNLK